MIDWHIYFHGVYNKLETAFVRDVLSQQTKQGVASICYDIGANAGYLTLLMASLARHVVAFEPSPKAYRTLLARIADNQIDHVKAFEIGCNDIDSEVDFERFGVGALPAKRVKSRHRYRQTDTFRASCKNGDKFVDEQSLPSPTLLRINAGDDQLHVLEGLYSTIQKAKPVLLLSLAQSVPRTVLDQFALRSFLYDDVSLFSLVESEDGLTYKLDPFNSHATRVVCAPSTMELMG
ncbi:MAG: FkbM family methyltransferase [Geminicoccaceae bacterium]